MDQLTDKNNKRYDNETNKSIKYAEFFYMLPTVNSISSRIAGLGLIWLCQTFDFLKTSLSKSEFVLEGFS